MDMLKRPSYDDIVFSYDPMFRLMREKGITDLQLARQIGVKVGVIRKIQLQQETTTMELIKSICKILDCGPGDLINVMKVKVYPAIKKDQDE